MALLSKPLPSLKLSSTPLLLIVLVVWLCSETKAFQSKFGPIFFGAPSPSLCSNRSARDGSFVQGVGENDEKEELIEEENPEADFDRQSLSGVRYGSVFDSLGVLYPPTDLEKRNAVSRSDGYWPYINSGEEPPKQFTYGEFDLYFFAELLDRALDYYNENQHVKSTNWNGKVFTDVGSGTGRLVFAAAALHPGWKLCRGVEVLQGIHDVAIETLDKCRYEIDVPVGNEEDDVNVNIKAKQESVDIVEGHDENNGESNVGTTTWKTFGTTFSAPQNDDDWLEKLREQYDDTAPAQDDAKTASDHDDVEDEDENLSPSEDEETTLQDQEANGSFEMYILSTSQDTETSEDEVLCLAPIEFSCGSFDDPYEYIGDSDLIFVFSSCMSVEMMSRLSQAFGRQCKPGTIIITTDYSLPLSGDIEALEDDENMPFGPFQLELLESIDGWCWLTGGRSTAHIHRVVSSLWEEGVGPRQKPEIPLEEQAWRIIQAYEAGELTDTNKFLREVRNSMIFAGLPESWLPSIDDDEEH